jgi:hypothetical protein
MNPTKTKRLTQQEATLQDFRDLTIYQANGCSAQTSRIFRDDMAGRAIVATPYGGCYGPAGWIICLNGSPPKCTIVAENGSDSIICIACGSARRLGPKQAETVRKFVAVHLQHLTAAVVIAPTVDDGRGHPST